MTHDHDHSELLVRDLTPTFNQSSPLPPKSRHYTGILAKGMHPTFLVLSITSERNSTATQIRQQSVCRLVSELLNQLVKNGHKGDVLVNRHRNEQKN